MVAALLSAARADCPSRSDLLEEARTALVEVEFEVADARLREFEVALGCGPVATPRELARFWVLDGALAWFRTGPEAATPSLAAARVTDPHLFVDSVGAEVRASWERADPAPGEGFVNVSPVVPDGTAYLDGRPTALPAVTTPGLHVVVVGGDHATGGRVVTVEAGLASTVELLHDEVPIAPAEPVRAPVVLLPPPWEPARRGFGLSVGMGTTAGSALAVRTPDGRTFDEHLVRPTVDVEAEWRWIGPRASLDVDVTGSLLVAGRYVWSAGESGVAMAGGAGATVGLGGRTGPWTLGLRGGGFFPGRIPVRYFVRRELGKEELEVRVGLNLVTERRPEFGAEVRVMLPVLGQQHRGLRRIAEKPPDLR